MEAEEKRTVVVAASDGESLINFRGSFIRYLAAHNNRVVCVSIEPPEEMCEGIAALGAEYEQVAGSRVGIGVGDGLKMIRDYRRLFLRLRPDICFFYMSKPTAFGSVAAALSGVGHYSVLVNGSRISYGDDYWYALEDVHNNMVITLRSGDAGSNVPQIDIGGNNGNMGFFQRLAAFFRKIVEFFRGLFNR